MTLPPGHEPPPQPSRDAVAMMRYDAAKRSAVIAYLLWFLLGTFVAHRFDLGRVGSGLAMLAIFALSWLLTFVLIGYAGLLLIGIWWVVDAFLIPGMTASYNTRLVDRIRA
jgi:TM2 domain-containing membrane protein YozV